MMSNTELTQKETESTQFPGKGKNFLYFVCDRGKNNIYIKGRRSVVIWEMDISHRSTSPW